MYACVMFHTHVMLLYIMQHRKQAYICMWRKKTESVQVVEKLLVWRGKGVGGLHQASKVVGGYE